MFNQNTQDQQTYLNHDDRNYIRQLGAFIGRIVTTLLAAVTMRIVGRDFGPKRTPDVETGLLGELQSELPVAATTLLTWNTKLGAETGANVSEFLVNNTRAMTSRYVLGGAQQARTHMPSFADSVAQSFMSQISSTVVQGMQDTSNRSFGSPRMG